MALGMARFEGYVDGNKPLGGNSMRRALSYGEQSLPAVWNGALYRSRIAAIMAPYEEKDKLDTKLEIDLWEKYTTLVADRRSRSDLLKHERDVL
jgi:hypothetical protein